MNGDRDIKVVTLFTNSRSETEENRHLPDEGVIFSHMEQTRRITVCLIMRQRLHHSNYLSPLEENEGILAVGRSSRESINGAIVQCYQPMAFLLEFLSGVIETV